MSIAQAQASALADKFLDNLGTGKDGIRPKETLTELFVIAGELIEEAQNNLNESNKHSSGNLSESLIAQEPTQSGKIVSINIMMAYYGLFVNSGVKGLQSGTSTAGYSFRTPNPSKNMVKAIQDWMDRASMGTRTVKKYSGYGKHETKNKGIAQASGAYAIAYYVKQKGLKPTGFMDKAVNSTRRKLADRLGAKLKIDIITALQL